MRTRGAALAMGGLLLAASLWPTTEVRADPSESQTCGPTEVCSRWPATLPFGGGQFYNGDVVRGGIFLVSETALVALSVTSFWMHHQLPAAAGADRAVSLQRRELRWRWTNWVSTGLLALVAAVGIIEAQLAYEPSAPLTQGAQRPFTIRF